MKTLWIGFYGSKTPERDVLASAIVREMRTRGVNAQFVVIRHPIFTMAVELGRIGIANEVEAFLVQSYGSHILHDAARQNLAADCAMAVVPDLNTKADLAFLRSLNGLVVHVTLDEEATGLAMPGELVVRAASTRTLSELRDTAAQVMKVILERLSA